MDRAIFAIYKTKVNIILKNYFSSDQGSKALDYAYRHDDHHIACDLILRIENFVDKKYKDSLTKRDMKELYNTAMGNLVDLIDTHAYILSVLSIDFRDYKIPNISFEDVITLNNPIFTCM